MKVAVTGKGGAGKTTVAAIFARTIARSGFPVLAVDADPNPNLGLALGMGRVEADELDSVVNAMLRESRNVAATVPIGHRDQPAPGSLVDVANRLTVNGPDGVRLLQTGRIERPADGCLCCGSHATTRRVFQELETDGQVLIADLEPGLADLVWVNPDARDTVVVVTDPSLKSVEVTLRAVRVVRELGVQRLVVVANRVESNADAALVRESLPDVTIVEVPEDAALAEAGASGACALDIDPSSLAVRVLSSLATQLLAPTGVINDS